MRTSNQVKQSLAVLLVAVALLGGCASFPDGDFKKVDKLPDQSRFQNKPSVFLDAKFFIDRTENVTNPVENTLALPRWKNTVENVTKDSGLFSKYTLDPFNGHDMDYVIRLEMINHVPNLGGAMVMGFITGFSLFVIPSAATDNYVLRAKVLDKSGQLIKSYEYTSSVTTWFGIWLLPLAGNSPQSVIPEFWGQMVKTAYDQIIKDNVLRYSALPAKTEQLAFLQ